MASICQTWMVKLTEATQGPARRALTYLGLFAAVVAVITTIGMVIAALGGAPGNVIVGCFVTWVISLVIVFAITRLLRIDDDQDQPKP